MASSSQPALFAQPNCEQRVKETQESSGANSAVILYNVNAPLGQGQRTLHASKACKLTSPVAGQIWAKDREQLPLSSFIFISNSI